MGVLVENKNAQSVRSPERPLARSPEELQLFHLIPIGPEVVLHTSEILMTPEPAMYI